MHSPDNDTGPAPAATEGAVTPQGPNAGTGHDESLLGAPAMLTVPTHVHDRVERLLACVTEAEARLIALRILVEPLLCPPLDVRHEDAVGAGR
jgi:hypothetical protein